MFAFLFDRVLPLHSNVVNYDANRHCGPLCSSSQRRRSFSSVTTSNRTASQAIPDPLNPPDGLSRILSPDNIDGSSLICQTASTPPLISAPLMSPMQMLYIARMCCLNSEGLQSRQGVHVFPDSEVPQRRHDILRKETSQWALVSQTNRSSSARDYCGGQSSQLLPSNGMKHPDHVASPILTAQSLTPNEQSSENSSQCCCFLEDVWLKVSDEMLEHLLSDCVAD